MNKIKLNVKGKNINLFIKKLKLFEIEIFKIEYIKHNEINIIIYKKDYEKINDVKKIYEMEIIELYGLDLIMDIMKRYKYILISLIVSFSFILILSRIIFSVKIVHNDKKIRTLLLNELKVLDIKPLSFKKNYKYIEKVKSKILKKYKDKIEWLEIENSGTKYIVKVEIRKKNNILSKEEPRNIVAKKDAIIMNINAVKGEIVKNKLDYVKKGDVIISGSIFLNEEIKENVSAKGSVYGEVWYKSIIEYPLVYKEKRVTNDSKNVYIIKINNNLFHLNTIKNYTTTKKRIILKHKFLPIELLRETKNKVIYKNEKLTIEEAINKAIKKVECKIKSKLNDKEYIISTKKLKVEENNSKIIVEVFTSVYEDITKYETIKGEQDDRYNNEKHN